MKVPPHVATGKRAPFPAGVFYGELAKVSDAWSEDQKDLAMVLEFRNITPADATSPNVGARPKMQRIQVIFDGQALVDVEEFDDNVPLALQNAATLVSQLAVAFGVTAPAKDGSLDFNPEPFLEDLMAGTYNNRTVQFEVQHRAWKSKKTGNSGTDDSIKTFKSAEETPVAAVGAEAEITQSAAPLRGLRTRN